MNIATAYALLGGLTSLNIGQVANAVKAVVEREQFARKVQGNCACKVLRVGDHLAAKKIMVRGNTACYPQLRRAF